MPESGTPDRQAPEPQTKTINLALQGGGSHGAFTWGALDRLLEDDRILIDGISGTSAGAMNGVMLVYGMHLGGRQGARDMLRQFWEKIGHNARFSMFQPSPLDRMFAPGNLDYSPMFQAFDLMTRLLSPYQLNPQDYNPLRDVLAEMIDFDKLRAATEIKLFISTTNVRSGKIRVFRPHELTADVMMASACLPHMFKAVEIDGEHYWDGGYMGNPAMFPLIYNCRSSDIVLIEINQIRIEKLPTTARDILERMSDISFNSTMMREMRAISLVTSLIEQHRLTGRTQLRPIHFHMIEAAEDMQKFSSSSKFNCDMDFLQELHDIGRRAAERWLASHFRTVGTDSSVDLHSLFF